MRGFPKKKNTYGLKEIIDALKQAKLERHQEDALPLNLLKIILSFLLPNKERNVKRYEIEASAIGDVPVIGAPAVLAPAIGSSSSAIKIGAVVVRVCSQLEEHDSTLPFGDTLLLGHYQFITPEKTAKRKREQKMEEDGKMKKAEPIIKKETGAIPRTLEFQSITENLLQQVAPGEILEVENALMVNDDVEVGREVNFNVISSEYGGNLLEWKKGEEKYNDDKKDVEEKVKSKEEEVQEMEETKNGDEKVDDVAEEEDSEQPTIVVYYTKKNDVQSDNETMVVAEVAKTDIVFFNQEEVVGETYQASADQTTIVSIEEQTLEVKKTKDEASQTKESKEEVEQNKEEVFEGKDDDD
ncbi:hypothetical protein GIB67_036421 [Kingdonia uniflora]|uniref:Uncharacterized protein n=1 Tax=Kingdonia uniflora TaxID=39325 RepID=A0A7J7L4A2_9MAGN|nr:hypothetical protein GIB67_036421 [Kingdonia uniflora]